jgi:hypothetical protein
MVVFRYRLYQSRSQRLALERTLALSCELYNAHCKNDELRPGD